MYVAKHYVRVNGTVYIRGEIIEDVLSPEKEERLLRLNAIERINPHQNNMPAATPDDTPAATPDDTPVATPDDDIPAIDITAGIVTEEKQPSEKPKKKASKKK